MHAAHYIVILTCSVQHPDPFQARFTRLQNIRCTKFPAVVRVHSAQHHFAALGFMYSIEDTWSRGMPSQPQAVRPSLATQVLITSFNYWEKPTRVFSPSVEQEENAESRKILPVHKLWVQERGRGAACHLTVPQLENCSNLSEDDGWTAQSHASSQLQLVWEDLIKASQTQTSATADRRAAAA